jgi:hypothetical protein
LHYCALFTGADFATFLQAPLWAFLAQLVLVAVVLSGAAVLAAMTGAHKAPNEATVIINDSALLFMMELLE